jgi:hypothetical protein
VELRPTATRISGLGPWATAIAAVVAVVLKAAIIITGRVTVVIIKESSIDLINEAVVITLTNFIPHLNVYRFYRLIKAYFIDFELGLIISF